MKRTIAILLTILTIALLMTGCSGTESTVSNTPDGTITEKQPNTNRNDNTVVPDTAPQPDVPNQDRYASGSVTDSTTDNAAGEFGQDMKDAANDVKDAIDDVTGSRASARRSGTGMKGGR